jgi:hypothetical protein
MVFITISALICFFIVQINACEDEPLCKQRKLPITLVSRNEKKYHHEWGKPRNDVDKNRRFSIRELGNEKYLILYDYKNLDDVDEEKGQFTVCDPREREWFLSFLKINSLDGIDGLPDIGVARRVLLSNNYISSIPKNLLSCLLSVRLLDLDKNCLRTIEKDCLPIATVFTLCLAYNHLTTLTEPEVFPPGIVDLTLNNNGLMVIAPGVLPVALQKLDLSYNPDLKDLSFLTALKSLQWLDLGYSTRETVDAQVFPASLIDLILEGNPLAESAKDTLRKAMPKTKIYFG